VYANLFFRNLVVLILGLQLAVAWATAQTVPHGPGSRIALVVGNASYPQAPLLNPVNDADAVSALLKRAGFSVDKRVNATQKDLREAAARFGEAIRDPKVKFALFYYAGHGVQLDWRNYLIPVNLMVRTAEDVRSQAVDISDLLRAMQPNQEKKYLVILDACRDNPFGATYQPAAKGLTLFAAPSGSLLAYSTAPGMVALDGQGTNGLYTSHLVQELGVAGANIEDAFKRVRLNVRLASKGQQVPWEITSWVEGEYLFPTARQQLTEAQREALLDEELARWAQVKTAQTIDPLADFIRQFPSGSTSELAQARLTRMLQAQSEQARQQAQAQAQAQRLAETKRLQDEQQQAQAQVLASAQQREEARRVADEQRRAEQKRLDDELRQAREQRLAEEKRQAQETRLAEELLAQARVAEQRAAKAKDAAERLAQAQRQAELQRAEQARLLAAAKLHAEQEASAREAQARLAAERERQQAQQMAVLKSLSLPEPQLPAPVAPEPVVVSLAATPYSPGYDEHQRRYRVGDEFVFRMLDGFSGREIPLEASGVRTPLRIRVTKVDAQNDRVEFNAGEYVTDLMGNTLKHLTGSFDEPRQFYPAELYVGKHWKSEFRQARTNGLRYTFRYTLRVVAREKITVPAGTFDAYRIEAEGFNMQLSASLSRKIWVVPGISADIASETLVRLRNGSVNQFDRQELVSHATTAGR